MLRLLESSHLLYYLFYIGKIKKLPCFNNVCCLKCRFYSLSTWTYIKSTKHLNIVSNNLDVVLYDLTEMNHKVNALNSEMAEVKDITQHLENDVKNLRIVSYTALAFGI